MQKAFLLFVFGFAILLCGCGKQEKINAQKIDMLAQRVVQMDQAQAKQMALLQAQLTLLAPEFDKMSSSYFEKNHDDAFFFHTNTLFLLLTIDKQIESELQTAAADRSVQETQLYNYHTNEMGMTYLCTAQIEAAMTAQEARLRDEINAASKQAVQEIKDSAGKQAATTAAENAAWRKQVESEIAQIRSDLDAIKAQLAAPSQPTNH